MDFAWSMVGLLVAVVVLVAGAWLQRRRQQMSLLKRYEIPGPEPSSVIFGNWKEFRRDPLEVTTKWIQKYGKFFGFYVGEMPYIVVADLDMIKHCLVRQAHIFRDRMPMILELETFKTSLVGLKGNDWKKVRSVMNPSFSGAKMKMISRVMNECVDIMLAKLDEQVTNNKTAVNVSKMTQGLTMDAIAKSILAWEPDSQRNPDDPFVSSLRKTLTEADTLILNIAIAFPPFRDLVTWVFPYVPYGKLFALICRRIHDVILVRRAEPHVRHLDMLQLMLDEQAKSNPSGSISDNDNVKCAGQEANAASAFVITDEHIVSNCFISLAAGFETTAVTLALILDELARSLEEQEKLYVELVSAFPGGLQRDVEYDELQSLKRLDMVVSEALRKNPPLVLFTTRMCNEDITVMGRTIPAGSRLVVPKWSIHRDPELWPEPEKFDPERFNPDNESNRHPASYIPFGIGPRQCMGRKFALLELKTALCKLILKYEFALFPGNEESIKLRVPLITICPVKNVVLSVKLRNRAT
ncbi:cytochrome P450 3A24-like [Dermacentor andersoni]|uniref:cytochrome P450 3A24-like n=1 Tax=Dermacentor andersoni TaxID=34620 RepID=UPI002155B161|nr:cytochrome P450 3A24-like [Dermacentor andersoni]